MKLNIISSKKLEARKEVEIAQARLNAYTQVLNNTCNEQLPLSHVKKETVNMTPEAIDRQAIKTSDSVINNSVSNTDMSNSQSDGNVLPKIKCLGSEDAQEINTLAKAPADSVNLNRLPLPEPNVFFGDPPCSI